MTPKGRELGLVDDVRWRAFSDKIEAIELERQRLRNTWVQPGSVEAENLSAHVQRPLTREYNLYELLKRPELDHSMVCQPESKVGPIVAEQLEIEAKYSGYIDRQQTEIERLKNHENTPIPASFNYSDVTGLSLSLIHI
mgnify:FL=1